MQILSTTVTAMAEVSPQLPAIIFCLVAMVSGSISLLLPETHGAAMPDTAEESEKVRLVLPGKICQSSVKEGRSEERGVRCMNNNVTMSM